MMDVELTELVQSLNDQFRKAAASKDSWSPDPNPLQDKNQRTCANPPILIKVWYSPN